MFWDNFYNACVQKGIKPNPLAKELQIASGSMTAWKGGKLPNGETLLKIADYLNVSVDYLLGRTNDPKSINQINTGDVGNNSNVNINKSSFSDTDNELISEFKKLTFNDKAKVMSLIAELSEKKA